MYVVMCSVSYTSELRSAEIALVSFPSVPH